MADSKITALTSISTSSDPANDPLVIVDVSDTSMAATGTTKKVTLNQLLACSPTATLASAAITGDLTVATDAFKVISATKDVCIGTVTPTFNNKLTVVGGGGGDAFITSGNGTRTGYIGTDGTSVIMGAYSNHALRIHVNDLPQMEVAALGVFNWYDGAGGTRMTLNASGLGVGGSPNYKLNVTGPATSFAGSPSLALYDTTVGSPNSRNWLIGNVAANNYGELIFCVSSAAGGAPTNVKMTLDSSGNLGIGVTPSAWDSNFKALQIGYPNFIAGNNGGNRLDLGVNAYFSTNYKYAATGSTASFYSQAAGQHSWYTAPSGTAGTTITDFATPKMTLDASGRLGVGAVPASNVRAHFKGSSTSTDFSIYCVNSSDKLTFSVRNDGLFITGSLTDVATLPSSPYNLTSGSAANVFVDSQGIFYRSTSSLKYKTDIADSTRGLADVLKLRPVTYKANNSGDTVFGGLIAEEVDAAGLTEFVQYAPDNTPDAIHYGNMVSLLVAAIKELAAEVNALKKA